MDKREHDEPIALPLGEGAGLEEDLQFRIELWDGADKARRERLLARAANMRMARAIFEAARESYPDRRITLRRGSRLIADSGK